MLAIGMMSGTSFDGIDLSLIETDGQLIFTPIKDLHFHYPIELQSALKDVANKNLKDVLILEKELTLFIADKVLQLLDNKIDVIGFSGQTVLHDPINNLTCQIGNPHLLRAITGIRVISDFRRGDVAHGGQGAPLIPVFHQCLMNQASKPVAVVNIGGVANVTYIGEDELIAYDLGPGNSLIDDLMYSHYGVVCDIDGKIAATGEINQQIVHDILQDQFFTLPFPKSLDRNSFYSWINIATEKLKSPQDIIATINYLTVMSIVSGLKLLPQLPSKLYVCGGGVKNLTMMRNLAIELSKYAIDMVILENSDFIESRGFGYLAVRFMKNLPSSFAKTTGVIDPQICGVLF